MKLSNKSGYWLTLHKIYQVDEEDRILITNDKLNKLGI